MEQIPTGMPLHFHVLSETSAEVWVPLCDLLDHIFPAALQRNRAGGFLSGSAGTCLFHSELEFT